MKFVVVKIFAVLASFKLSWLVLNFSMFNYFKQDVIFFANGSAKNGPKERNIQIK